MTERSATPEPAHNPVHPHRVTTSTCKADSCVGVCFVETQCALSREAPHNRRGAKGRRAFRSHTHKLNSLPASCRCPKATYITSRSIHGTAIPPASTAEQHVRPQLFVKWLTRTPRSVTVGPIDTRLTEVQNRSCVHSPMCP